MKPLALALIATLSLAACTPDADAPAEGGGAGGGSSESGGGGGIASALTGESCLHGTWAADATQTFTEENFRRMMPQQEGAPDIRLAETSGRALVTFAPDGAMTQQFEDFAVTFDSDVQGMAMRMTMTMTGANEARYTVTGDQLAFQSDDGAGENTMRAVMSVEMAGQTLPAQEMDSALFEAHEGEGGAAITYECSGDELLLDIAAEDQAQIFFNDARYTRVG